MASYYKIWVEIERIDETEDDYETFEPEALEQIFDTFDDAQEVRSRIINLCNELTGR